MIDAAQTRCGRCARLAAIRRRRARAEHRIAIAAAGRRGDVVWAAGRCRACGKPFAYPHPDAGYCSLACSGTRTEERARRRALLRQAFVAHVDRQAILERDDWRCQLCWLPIERNKVVPHPLAATLDHIVPLVAGGTHEPANVQAAHFICNSRKSDRAPEQLSLLG